MRRAALALLCLLWPGWALAVELSFPTGTRQLTERLSPLDSYELPVGSFRDGQISVMRVEGAMRRETWRVTSSTLTTLQVLEPLRQQLRAAGYQPLFQCEDRGCGGFDFRFQTEIVPPPGMYVDLRDFRFLSARRKQGQVLSLLVSQSRGAVYIQKFEVVAQGADEGEQAETVVAQPEALAPDAAQAGSDLVARLQADGHVVLSDLVFGSGAGALGEGPYDSLADLAEFLKSHPDYVIVLVGHTDSVGALARNIALSKQRAASVRARLIRDYNVAEAQVRAEGNGYLSPVASNLTEQGRKANRRVEAVLLPRN